MEKETGMNSGTSRIIHIIHSFTTGILPERKSAGLVSCLLIQLLIPVSGCMQEEESSTIEDGEPQSSYIYHIRPMLDDRISTEAERPGNLVLITYEADGVRDMISCERYDTIPGTITLESRHKGMTVVGLANFPDMPAVERISRYDIAEQLRYRLRDEDLMHPLTSGECWTEGGDTVDLWLTPLLCRVTLTRIDNLTGGLSLLEDPELVLVSSSTDAEILRHSGFRPTSEERDSICVRLETDIGSSTVFPAASLYCYPNDDMQQGVGCPPAELTLRCICDGKAVEYSSELPPIRRNSVTEVSLVIEGPDKYEFLYQ